MPLVPDGYDPCLALLYEHPHRILPFCYRFDFISLKRSQCYQTCAWCEDVILIKTTPLMIKFHVKALLEIMIWAFTLLFLLVLVFHFH